MTCNKNSILYILVGIVLLGLAGCSSQPYKPWQPGDDWWDKEQQARKEAALTKAAEQDAAAKQMPPPVMDTEPGTESMPVVQPIPRRADIEPSATTPPRVVMEPQPPLTSGMTAPARSTTGDVLLIDSIQAAPDIKTPRNGMTMEMVRRQFGNPISEGSSIGDPPITRWEYKGFSVYFEHNLVLHSVTNRPNRN